MMPVIVVLIKKIILKGITLTLACFQRLDCHGINAVFSNGHIHKSCAGHGALFSAL